jgi:hypothetical protein
MVSFRLAMAVPPRTARANRAADQEAVRCDPMGVSQQELTATEMVPRALTHWDGAW